MSDRHNIYRAIYVRVEIGSDWDTATDIVNSMMDRMESKCKEIAREYNSWPVVNFVIVEQ